MRTMRQILFVAGLLVVGYFLFPLTSAQAQPSFSPENWGTLVWVDHDSVQAIWDREEVWSFKLRKGRKCWSFTADTTTNNIMIRVWSVHDSMEGLSFRHITVPDTLVGTVILFFNMGRTPQYPRKVWK